MSTDLKDVRDKLGEILDQETILVGHGLENDLKALRLVHLSVIDTAIVELTGPQLQLLLLLTNLTHAAVPASKWRHLASRAEESDARASRKGEIVTARKSHP